MKALVLDDYNKLTYRDFLDPECEADEVLVRVQACGICGSDVHGMDGSTGRRIPPIVMGHEASGVIERVGSEVIGWSVGERVTFDSTIYPLDDWFTLRGKYNLSDRRRVLGVSCEAYRQHGAFAEYVAVPQHILHRIPEHVTFEQAALVEPAAVAVHAVELTPISLADTVVVVGVGVIGLLLVQVLQARGCSQIIAVDRIEERLEKACQFGADVGLNPDRTDVALEVQKLTDQRGADAVFEAVGISPTVNLAINCLRKGGSLTLIGNLAPQVEIPLQTIVTREIRLQGSCAIAGEYPAVLRMIEKRQLDVDAIISNTAPLSEGADWFRRLYDQEPGLLKVILKP